MLHYNADVNALNINRVWQIDGFFFKLRLHKYSPSLLKNHVYSHKRYFHFHDAEIQNAFNTDNSESE